MAIQERSQYSGGTFRHGRASPITSTLTNRSYGRPLVVEHLPARRRAVGNLNRRYDRMIESVTLVARAHTSTSPRKRRRIYAPESLSSCDSIKASNNVGEGLAVIDLRENNQSCVSIPDSSAVAAIQEEVPQWLAGTLFSLILQHPLRRLLSRADPQSSLHSPRCSKPPRVDSSNARAHLRSISPHDQAVLSNSRVDTEVDKTSPYPRAFFRSSHFSPEADDISSATSERIHAPAGMEGHLPAPRYFDRFSSMSSSSPAADLPPLGLKGRPPASYFSRKPSQRMIERFVHEMSSPDLRNGNADPLTITPVNHYDDWLEASSMPVNSSPLPHALRHSHQGLKDELELDEDVFAFSSSPSHHIQYQVHSSPQEKSNSRSNIHSLGHFYLNRFFSTTQQEHDVAEPLLSSPSSDRGSIRDPSSCKAPLLPVSSSPSRIDISALDFYWERGPGSLVDSQDMNNGLMDSSLLDNSGVITSPAMEVLQHRRTSPSLIHSESHLSGDGSQLNLISSNGRKADRELPDEEPVEWEVSRAVLKASSRPPTPRLSAPLRLAFTPAPGIYISPLKGSHSDVSVWNISTSADDDQIEDFTSTQESDRDSIESWTSKECL